jgi:hypothetical protein
MGGSVAVVLAGGGTQLASAALTVLTDFATGIGALVMLTVVVLAALYGLAAAADTRPHPPTEPNPVLAAYRDECPWCDTRDCLDSTLCNCGEACGSWLCVVKEASNG